GATPITRPRAPFALAFAGVSGGNPVVTVAAGSAYSPTHCSRAQSRKPNAVLASGADVVSPRNNRYGCGRPVSIMESLNTRRRGIGTRKETSQGAPILPTIFHFGKYFPKVEELLFPTPISTGRTTAAAGSTGPGAPAYESTAGGAGGHSVLQS